MEKLRQSKK